MTVLRDLSSETFQIKRMPDPLTVFGELTAVAWTKEREPAWNLATDKGQALYWEWTGITGRECSAEDFIVFTRSIFPNGGQVCQSHCNHSLIWTINEGDVYGIGIRKLQHNSVWVVAILESPELYPGSSMSPDRRLNLDAVRFVAEEFLRGTDPMDIFNCQQAIVEEGVAWWKYLQSLERIVNWKYPEVKIFKRRTAPKETESDGPRRGYRDRRFGTERRSSWSRDTSPVRSTSRQGERKISPSRNEYINLGKLPRRSRSRSPPRFTAQAKRSPQDSGSEGVNNKRNLCCKTCDIYFEHSYELMRHYNSEGHQSALLREFPI